MRVCGRRVGPAVVGHDPLDLDPLGGEDGDGDREGACGALAALVGRPGRRPHRRLRSSTITSKWSYPSPSHGSAVPSARPSTGGRRRRGCVRASCGPGGRARPGGRPRSGGPGARSAGRCRPGAEPHAGAGRRRPSRPGAQGAAPGGRDPSGAPDAGRGSARPPARVSGSANGADGSSRRQRPRPLGLGSPDPVVDTRHRGGRTCCVGRPDGSPLDGRCGGLLALSLLGSASPSFLVGLGVLIPGTARWRSRQRGRQGP